MECSCSRYQLNPRGHNVDIMVLIFLTRKMKPKEAHLFTWVSRQLQADVKLHLSEPDFNPRASVPFSTLLC